MWLLLWVFFIVLFLLIIFYLLNFFIGVKDWEMCKLSAFESGFLSMGKIQNSFSVHFFIMMLIFVIFDLEIVLFLGIIISDLNFFWNTFLLFLFIIGGFYLEWWMGKLIWVI